MMYRKGVVLVEVPTWVMYVTENDCSRIGLGYK